MVTIAMRPAPSTARGATLADVEAIAALVNDFAAEDIMLPRTTEQVRAAIDDFVVVRDARGRVMACGALREYSPSLAELVSLAVTREEHGRGLGSRVVEAVEHLALKRGFGSVFAHSLSPAFFEANGYAQVERTLFPEKKARAGTSCVWKELVVGARIAVAA